jgi:hypothetical protein
MKTAASMKLKSLLLASFFAPTTQIQQAIPNPDVRVPLVIQFTASSSGYWYAEVGWNGGTGPYTISLERK